MDIVIQGLFQWQQWKYYSVYAMFFILSYITKDLVQFRFWRPSVNELITVISEQKCCR